MARTFSVAGPFEVYGWQRRVLQTEPGVRYSSVDLTDPGVVEENIALIDPELIIHCAALVNVDGCENDQQQALRIHSGVIEQMHRHCPSAHFVYISTDSVFDGTKGDYLETDQPHPLNFYAVSKRQGEQTALRLFANCMVVRTNIYGFHNPAGQSLAEWALQHFLRNEPISGFTDVMFNPLYTRQLALVVKELVGSGYNGIINAAADRYVSKYDFLVELARKFGYDTALVNPRTSASMAYKARRPANTTLNTEKLVGLIAAVPKLADGLHSFFTDFKSKQG